MRDTERERVMEKGLKENCRVREIVFLEKAGHWRQQKKENEINKKGITGRVSKK